MFTLQTETGELSFTHLGGELAAGCATVDPAQWRAAAQALARH